MKYFFYVNITNFGTTLSEHFHYHNKQSPKVRPVVVIPIPCTQGMVLIVSFIKNFCIVIYWSLIWYKTNEHSLQVSHVVNVVNQLFSDLAVHQWFPTFSCRDPKPPITAWLPTMRHYILCAFQHSTRIPLLTEFPNSFMLQQIM